MKTIKRFTAGLFAVALLFAPIQASAAGVAHSTVGVGGYDLVSYHNGEKPLRGNGNHVAVYESVTYLFANEGNREIFLAAPAKYVPAYGGYCAYGASVGKKFVADPDVWDIVDGRLYLNLDNRIKGLWSKDVTKSIAKADAEWPKIVNKDPADL